MSDLPSFRDLPATDRAALVALAHRAADAARAPALSRFRGAGLAVENKDAAGYDPVTDADRETERAIRAVIRGARPQDGFLGEEDGLDAAAGGYTWVVDPIDGTRAYVIGAPTWGVLIALNDGAPAMGVMDQPFTGERFWNDGEAAWRTWRDGAPVRMRTSAATLETARLCTTFPEVGTLQERHAFERVRDRARLVRYGLDCYAYMLLAGGHVDLVIEAGLHSYDIQALIPIIRAAGGVVTTWDGGDPQQGGRVIAAGSAALHEAAMTLLRG